MSTRRCCLEGLVCECDVFGYPHQDEGPLPSLASLSKRLGVSRNHCKHSGYGDIVPASNVVQPCALQSFKPT